MAKKNADSPKCEPDEDFRYQGKTHKEWREEVLLASGLNPLDFLVGDGTADAVEARIQEVISKNNGTMMALMYVDAIFGVGQAPAYVFRVNTVRYTERTKVSMQKTKDGRMVGMSAAGAPGVLDKLLRGEARLSPGALVPVPATRYGV
jgi:hypothetical protein